MKKRTTPTPIENKNTPPGSSHLSPASLGVTLKTTIERGDPYMAPEIYNVEIAVLEIVRGKEAEKRVKAQGISENPPNAGFEYILTRIKLRYFPRTRGLGEEPYILTEGQFVAVSADGKQEYKIPPVQQQPQPQLIDRLFQPRDSHEGWILVQVSADEKKPLLVFKREHVASVFGMRKHVWFQLY